MLQYCILIFLKKNNNISYVFHKIYNAVKHTYLSIGEIYYQRRIVLNDNLEKILLKRHHNYSRAIKHSVIKIEPFSICLPLTIITKA